MIVFVSSSRSFGDDCIEAARELALSAVVIEGAFEEALSHVRELMRTHDVEAVVALRGTAGFLRERLQIPVVDVEVTDADILRAVVTARRSGRRIGVFLYEGAPYAPDLDLLSEIAGVELIALRYRENSEILPLMINARDMGLDALIVGLPRHLAQIEALGMCGVHLDVSRRALLSAVLRCTHVLRVRRADQELAIWQRSVLESVSEGLVAFDAHGKLTLMNPAAERILDMKEEEARLSLERPPAPELLGRLVGLVNSGAERTDVVYELGRYQVVANTRTINVSGRRIGTLIAFQEITRVQQLETHIRRSIQMKGLTVRYTLSDVVGESPAIQRAVQTALQCAQMDYTVLVQGETGVGKEVFAQGIHAASDRRDGPFVAINCGALPESLLESELFGYQEGAFTSAKRGGKVGMFELAHQGTIFLDEVARLPLVLQASLLRVLQERQVMRLGGDRVIPVDVRIIAATNRDLWEAVRAGEFREDLFFRLNVLKVRVPPLRERVGDVDLLVDFFVRQHRAKAQRTTVDPETRARLRQYRWPGNVRELEHSVLRLMLLGDQEELFITSEPEQDDGIRNRSPDGGAMITIPNRTLPEMERMIIAEVVRRCGSRTAAAQSLGINRVTLWRKLQDTGDHVE